MKPPHLKLQSEAVQQEHALAQEQTVQTSQAREFASAEEVLRFDAAQTPLPAELGARVEQSIQNGQVPAGAPASWWRRWFGEGSASDRE